MYVKYILPTAVLHGPAYEGTGERRKSSTIIIKLLPKEWQQEQLQIINGLYWPDRLR